MAEFSQATGRERQDSAKGRNMQCDKQPSPWPCVIMLVGLLVFCLAAPQYWQHDRSTGVATDADAPNANWATDFAFDVAPPVTDRQSDALNLWSPPTIDDLIAARSTASQFDGSPANGFGQSTGWQPFTRQPEYGSRSHDLFVEPAQTQRVEAHPFVTSSLESLGAAVADYSPASTAARVASRLVDFVPHKTAAWPSIMPINSAASSPPSLKLASPDDRVAMLPAPPEPSAWCVPRVLFEQLERLGGHPFSAQWASHVSNQLHALTEREQIEGDDVQAILADLATSAQDARQMAETTDDEPLRVELLRAHWALARRLDCWAAMHEFRVAERAGGRVAARGELSPYFDSAPPAAPVADVAGLSKELEAYEKSRDPQLGRLVVAEQKALAASDVATDRALADAMEQHYRNANIRVAVTAEMLNRMIGPQRSETRPIRDRIAGAAVRGQSDIQSESRVQLVPAENEWRMDVRTNGTVDSKTFADAGQAGFRSVGQTDFAGRKTVIVDSTGVRLQPSDVVATSRNRLVGVTTDYDWMPIFGGFARDRAIQEYRARQSRARSQVESRVQFDASQTLDRETHEAMENARKNLYDRFTNRFDEFGIKLTTVEMKSTPERVVARVRIAGDDQLGSHTPRPRALSDSLASVQVHETAMNNLAVTLGLDGKRYTAPELQDALRERFPKLATKDPLDARHDTVFQFVPNDAVQVHVADGKLELRIAFASVELEGDAIPDVIVHASYIPSVNGLTADLTRDGALGIEGRFSSGERARLHNIFKTVLPPERHLPLVRLNDPNDNTFQGLMITQLVLEDGWLGLALGPESTNRVAERERSLR